MRWADRAAEALGEAARRTRPHLHAAGRRALDLLMPPHALDGDGGERPFAPGLSAERWSRFAWVDGPVCDGCGQPYAYDLRSRCAACTARPRAFDRARCACLYDEGPRELILQLKHGDRVELGPLFARWLQRAAAPLLETCDAVAPVPMHRARLFKRRYNQAAEISRALARLAGRRHLPDALVRARDTGGQGGRSRRGRREAVRGAFSVPDPRRVQGLRILLVDDVLTTGATAEACARALKAAGAASVTLAVVARVQEAEALAI